jgi:hypothetical protein
MCDRHELFHDWTLLSVVCIPIEDYVIVVALETKNFLSKILEQLLSWFWIFDSLGSRMSPLLLIKGVVLKVAVLVRPICRYNSKTLFVFLTKNKPAAHALGVDYSVSDLMGSFTSDHC